MHKISYLVLPLLLAGAALHTQAQEKPVVPLTVDAVQAANLDTYYQTQGSWHFVLANGDAVQATLAVTTSGYNHIAGEYDLAGSESIVSVGQEEIISAGQLSVAYVSEGTEFPVYHFEGTLETASTLYTVDVTTEVFAYDYLYYLYYQMGAFSYQQILVILDDAPDDAEHPTHEVTLTTGYLINYIGMMGALQIRAENEDGLLLQLILDASEFSEDITYQLSTTYAVYCYLGDMNTEVYLATFKSGTATLKVVAQDTVEVEATLVAKGGDVYHFIITGLQCDGVVPSDLDTLQPDELRRTLSNKRLVNGKLIIERNGQLWSPDGHRISK